MKVSYDHLMRFFYNDIAVSDLSDKLFQLGHEHEVCNNLFEFEFTPNKGDCLSLNGLARELSYFYDYKLLKDIYTKDIDSLDINFDNRVPSICSNIAFLLLEVESLPENYSDYLENYFSDLEINKTNFFADISNYLAYELGNPTHCYDYLSIGKNIKLSLLNKNSTFTDLHGKEHILNKNDLVFSDENGIINLAGVIGGKNSACNKTTKKVLIECAYFDPESIIGTSLRYNIASDAAYKFERGVDPNNIENSIRRFVHIVSEHCKIKDLRLFNKKFFDKEQVKLDTNINKINKILGTKVEENKFNSILKSLGFGVDEKILVPSHRSDIKNYNDIGEEIARYIGYDNISRKPLSLSNSKEITISNDSKLRTYLSQNGFQEVINFPFTSIETKNSIKLANPLDSNKKFLRANLKESLLNNLIFNENRQKDSIKLFEISNVYEKKDPVMQTRKLGIIISGRQSHDIEGFNKRLDAKFLDTLFKKVDITLTNQITEISRERIKSKNKNKIYYLEIPLTLLENSFKNIDFKVEPISGFKKYKKISEFPSSTRDFSFSLKYPNQLKEEEFFSIINNSSSKYLKSFFMFDNFLNEKNNELKIAYRFIFQANSKTLTDDEINLSLDAILGPILELEYVNIPGLEK